MDVAVADGRLAAPVRTFGALTSGHDHAGGAAYDAGDVYGTPVHSDPMVAATYVVRKITAIDISGNPLPDGMKILLIPHSPDLVPAYGDDGDTFAPMDAGGLYLAVYEAPVLEFGTGNFGVFEPSYDVLFPAIPVKADGNVDDPADDVVISTYLVVPEGAADTAGSVGVTVLLEKAGPLPSTTVFDV